MIAARRVYPAQASFGLSAVDVTFCLTKPNDEALRVVVKEMPWPVITVVVLN